VNKGIVLISSAVWLLQFFITYSKVNIRGQVTNSSTTGEGIKSERINVIEINTSIMM
jgi:hypothetical protein